MTHIRSLEERDVPALVSIRRVSFLDDTDYEAPDKHAHLVGRLRHMSGVFLEDELVAAGAMLPFRMHHGQATLPVGGLASVVSAAQHRRKGHVRKMLHTMLEGLRDDGVGFCLEYPFDSRYYAKFGWQTIPNGAIVEVTPERFENGCRAPSQLVDVAAGKPPESVAAIYENWARNYNFTMTRDGDARDDWYGILRGSPWEEPSKTRFTYLFDEAYCVLQLRREKERGTVAYVVDCAWSSDDGRRAMFGFFASLDGQVDLFHLQLPYGDPTLLDLTPYSIRHPHPVQGRIVDVCTALNGHAVEAAIDVKFAVIDDFCAWNEGSFRLVSEAGVTHAERTSLAATTTIDVRDLMLLVADQPSAHHLQNVPSDLRAALTAIAARPAYMPLADYF